ncbi:geranylgeranyl diphosphate synthase type II [Roseiarcus fermentans]|uniref:Geranylgeranyl diphosphate synthase type II n=1 Tax=Roseiarcus fermentans TaxID=1473586 RepID=A0A366F336_9HYPH|nr:polyprenyl synthetase family protein [Roseiarcus fermentans]RBP09038.1 geranylgeranyl diphosphate synthase type II [Roseiarcus fermentans]
MERAAFLDRLAEYGGLARKTLLARLPEGEPARHLYQPMRDFCARSGKGIRPALLIASCRAFGGALNDALPSAAALELLHNAFLIHDDIQDQSETRRGVPCLHAELGVPLAINVGDAMMANAFRMLWDNIALLGPGTAARVLDEFDHLTSESLEGQALELGWIRDNALDVGPADYLRMTLKKTCWYSFIHPCRIGALIARGGGDLDSFNEFGFLLGAAFQIRDDILNLVGSEDRYGKEILGDLYEGKRTLMLARLAGALDGRDHARLTRFLATPRGARKEAEVVWVFDAMKRHDCIAYARTAADRLVEGAKAAFPTAFAGAAGEDRDFIAHLLDYMVEREA